MELLVVANLFNYLRLIIMKTSTTASSPASPQAEEYLEAICRIRDRRARATPTELARELAVAPPSVLGMLRRLEKQGWIRYSRQMGATLTKRGEVDAGSLRRHHRLAERMLTDLLGVPWERSHEIACRFEHVIDDEVEACLRKALHNPDTCPHGNPIGSKTSGSCRPLAALGAGQSGRLRRVVDESSANLAYLRQMQLLPGTRVAVCSVAPGDGPLTVEVRGVRHGLSRSMAECLFVETEGAVR
jgi:DtxR family Mn-dependent transcriptional regulator